MAVPPGAHALALAAGLLALPAAAQEALEVPVRGAVAFSDVDVLPLDADRSLRRHTVVVEAGRITALGPDGSVRLPARAQVLRGGWLMPGLVDAHTHEAPLSDWPDDTEGNLVLYLANGITTIVNMGDFTGGMLGVRERVRAGQLAGPEVYVGHFARGPADGGTAETLAPSASAARALVRSAHAQGYDFVKVYDSVPADAFDALVSEGRAMGLVVAGHLPRFVGLAGALGNGLVMLAHADAVVPRAGGPGSPGDLAGVLALLRSSGASVTPTLHVYDLITGFGLDGLAGRDPWARVVTQEGIEYMDDRALESWTRMLQFRADLRAPTDRRAWLDQMRQVVRACDDAGIPLLAGADTIGVPGVVPGFSIHGELRQLREAGLAPWRALAAATRNAGDFLRARLQAPEPVGRIEVGARADLVLLDHDPREDPDTLRRPLAVMAAGRLYTQEALRAQLDALRVAR